MAYTSIQKMVDDLIEYNAEIEEIPDIFEIHGDYLIDGMTVNNFIAGYKAYRDLIKQLNTDMVACPDCFGLLTADKKGVVKPVNSFQFPFLWLFIALARSGEVKQGTLYVSGATFLAYTEKGKKLGDITSRPKNIGSMINKLPEYGFIVENYIHGEPSNFTIGRKENPYLLPAIKASTLSRYQEKSIVCDYACFNYMMFKTAPKEKMNFTDTHTAKKMKKEYVDRANAIINGFASIGLSPAAERHHNYGVGWMKFGVYFQFYYGVDGLRGILNIHDLYNHEKHLETLPEKYLNVIKNNLKCRGCGFKGSECKWRRTDELFGEKRIWCNSSNYLGLVFPTNIDDVPYAVDIIANIHGKKKRV